MVVFTRPWYAGVETPEQGILGGSLIPRFQADMRAQVESRSTLPLISIGFTATVAFLLSLIVFGSTLAFNDVVSLSISGLYTSYLIGNGLLLYRRLAGHIRPFSAGSEELTNTIDAEHLTWGPWRIREPIGTAVNMFSCAYLVVVLHFSYFPTAINPTAASMNYSSLMVGSVTLFSIGYYLIYARKTYTGPVIEIDRRDNR